MRDQFPFFTEFTIPSGATSGTRTVFNEDNSGTIRWYNEFDELVAELAPNNEIGEVGIKLSGPGGLADLWIEGPNGIYQSVARGVVSSDVYLANSPVYNATGVTDMSLSNVPTVAGRRYDIDLHTQCVQVGAGSWRIDAYIAGNQVGRFGAISSAVTDLIDASIEWTAPTTGTTTDIEVRVQLVSGAPTLQFQASATVERYLRLVDRGV